MYFLMNVPYSWAFGKELFFFFYWLLAFRCHIKKAIYFWQGEESPQCLRHYRKPQHFETNFIVLLYSVFFSVTFEISTNINL